MATILTDDDDKDGQGNSWNVLWGAAGVPQPPSRMPDPQAAVDAYMSQFPSAQALTGGKYLAIPLAQNASNPPQSPPHNDVLWGQLGKGVAQAIGGGLTVAGGAGLTDTGVGAIPGVPLMTAGVSYAVQGATMANDAWHGRASQGVNPVKDTLKTLVPGWGGAIYDGAELEAAALGAITKVPLMVDPAVAGINRAKSVLGVRVPQINNGLPIPGTGVVLDSALRKPIFGVSVANKLNHLRADFSGRQTT